MKKLPYLSISLGCFFLSFLVVARCSVTVGREAYYGSSAAMEKVMADPWFYIGIAATLVGLCCGLLFCAEKKKDKMESQEL